MNERIKKLIEQCSEYSDMHQGIWFNKEKFAELIVKDCAMIAAINQAENMDWDISEIIKEHFGVE